MRSARSWIGVIAVLHLSVAAVRAADPAATAGPPEVKINEQSAAASGLPKETTDAVAKAIQVSGVAWDLNDEKRLREAVTGAPAVVDVGVAAMQAEHASRAASKAARERVSGVPATATQPARVGPVYTRTDYHRRVLAEPVTITGDANRVTIARPPRTEPSYVVEKTPQGWRMALTEEELQGAAPEKALEAFRQSRQALELIAKRIEAGEVKTWQEFTDATSAIRKTFRQQLSAARPATAPAR